LNKDVSTKTLAQYKLQTLLTFKLKAHTRELYEQLKARDSEIEHLKKNIKITKQEEMSKELEVTQ
jgi:hypothetical protein